MGDSDAGLPSLGAVLHGGSSHFVAAELDFLDCVEIGAERFLYGEPAHRVFRNSERLQLEALTQTFDLCIETLSTSLGTPGSLDCRDLQALQELTAATRPLWVSDRAAFSRSRGIDLGSFLPLPPSPTTIDVLAGHLLELSDALQVPILLQKVFSPLRLKGSLQESEFFNRLCSAAECGLLIDVGVWQRLGTAWKVDPIAWVRDIDPGYIGAIRFPFTAGEPGEPMGSAKERERILLEVLRHARPRVVILDDESGAVRRENLQAQVQRLRTLGEAPWGATAGCRSFPEPADRQPEAAAVTEPAARVGDRDQRPPLDTAPALVRTLEGVRVAYLDEGAVLFSAHHQELHALNSAAAFIWSCLEEDRPPADMATQVAAAFDVTRPKALAAVWGVLRRCQELGFAAPVGVDPGESTDLCSALTLLMRNPLLREAFQDSPRHAAWLLNIAPQDREAFLAMDPSAVEQQASLSEQQRRWIRSPLYHQRAAGDEVPERLGDVLGQLPKMASSRRYRLLNTVFRIDYHSVRQFEQIHPTLEHLEVSARGTAQRVLQIVDSVSGDVLCEEGRPVHVCGEVGTLAPQVASRIRRIATGRFEFLAKIHAGVVSTGGACAIFPARAGSGKTTLVAALVASGLRYFSDEYALLKNEDLNVVPVPFALSVKDGSIAVLQRHFPQLQRLTAHVRIDGRRVRYLTPPADRCAVSVDEAEPVRWVIFPRYDAAEATRLVPLDRIEALRRLLDQCLVLPEDLDWPKVQRLTQWFRGIECYEMPLSSLTEAVELVRSLGRDR